MRNASNIMTTVVLVWVLIFAFLLVGMRLFGLEPYTVLSGSMEPEYHVGSLIYVKKTTAAELTVNTPITYKMSNGVVVTHRIVEIIVDENDPTKVQYVTKGDANDDKDGTAVEFDSVIGRPVFTIPILGYVCYFIQNPPGSFIIVALLLLVVFLAFLPDLIKSIGEKAEGSEKLDASESLGTDEAKRLINELEALRAELERRNANGGEDVPPQKNDGISDENNRDTIG